MKSLKVENIHERGYLLGATNYRAGFQFAYCGSVLNTTFAPRYQNAGQSINYVECHDNMTTIDKLLRSNSNESLEVHLNPTAKFKYDHYALFWGSFLSNGVCTVTKIYKSNNPVYPCL